MRFNTIPSHSQLFSEALYLAASQAKQIEEQQLMLEHKEKEIKERDTQIIQLSSEVSKMEKITTYMDKVFACKSTVKTTIIAQDYGKSAKAFNNLLHEHGVQYKCGDQWVLYAKYLTEGYVKDVPFSYTDKQGVERINSNTQWTQKRACLHLQLPKGTWHFAIDRKTLT